jgi:hypothetical protein
MNFISRFFTRKTCALLAVFMFAESAHAHGGPAAIGLAMFVMAMVNLIFYGLVLIFCARVIWVLFRKRKIATWSLILATLPFLHYSVEVIRAHFEPDLRARKIASLMQQRTVASIQPRSIETLGFEGFDGNKDVGALVAAGVVDEVQTSYPGQNKTSVLKLHEGPECIDFENSGGDRAELRRVVLARYAFQRCISQTMRDGAPNSQAQLFIGDRAPNRYTGPACLGGGNYPLELRWGSQYGGGLLAFWESPSFISYAFPPKFPGGEHIWECKYLYPDSPDYHFPDKFKFVSAALGFKNIEDFPKSPDAAMVPAVLRRLIPRMDSRYAHDHILAILGQWPSTPAIDAILNDQRVTRNSDYMILTASAILTDPRNEERKKNLYPYLMTHVPTLLKICSHRTGLHDTREPCAKLTALASLAEVINANPAPSR